MCIPKEIDRHLRKEIATKSLHYAVRLKKKTFFSLILISLVISIFSGFFYSKILSLNSHLKKKKISSENFIFCDAWNCLESKSDSIENGKNSKYEESNDWSIENCDDSDADENELVKDSDEENNIKLYEIPGMSHQMIGVFRGLKSSFLLSEEDILNVMYNVADKASTTPLSSQCTRTHTRSLFCDLITADKSHFIMRTIVFDGSSIGFLEFNLLLSNKKQMSLESTVFPELEKSLSEYHSDEVYELNGQFMMHKFPTVKWIINVRQFPHENIEIRNPYLGGDLNCHERFLGNYDILSNHIKSIETPFQRIDIYDFVDPRKTSLSSYHHSLQNDNTYESRNPELFNPNRVVFLDGVMQSSSRGNEAYHEALVQPAMFAHKNPRRVAIVGGGEGATLREALKHKSVENVIMIDIDEDMCKESAKILYPAWNGCNDFFNVTNSCFDDSRADVRYEDALAWFMNRFSSTQTKEDKFDIIIMDALDPQDTVDFAVALYQNVDFWKSLYNALTDDGILVAQLGSASELIDPGQEYDKEQQNRHYVIRMLQIIGFQSLHCYEEAHCEFEDPWTFLVACKSTACRSNWYRNPGEVDLDIHQRLRRTISKQSPLSYFDGSTMASYHIPHKASEAVYCRDFPIPQECMFHHSFYSRDNMKYSSDIGMNAYDIGKVVRISSSSSDTLYRTQEAYSLEPVKYFFQLLDHKPEKENFYLKASKYHNISRFDAVTDNIITFFHQPNSSTDTYALSFSYSPMIERHLPLYASLFLDSY